MAPVAPNPLQSSTYVYLDIHEPPCTLNTTWDASHQCITYHVQNDDLRRTLGLQRRQKEAGFNRLHVNLVRLCSATGDAEALWQLC
jgi:hypothetical protein